MPTVSELKERSGAKVFVSIIGRSTIKSNSLEYKLIEAATTTIIGEGDSAVIHGGYPGGAMSAVNDTADIMVTELGLPVEYNIAVPQVQYDHCPRVLGAVFTDSAPDIFDRLRAILAADILIVSPLGAIGTELELTAVLHENIYCEHFSCPTKPRPIIILTTAQGTDWRLLIETKLRILGYDCKDLSCYDWLYFVDSDFDFLRLFKRVKNNLLDTM